MYPFVKKHLYALLLSLLCLIIIVSHTLYVLKTHQYPEQDEHVYLTFAVQFFDIFKHPTSHIFSELSAVNPSRQPFYGLILSLPLLLFGTAFTYKIALWMNVIWYIMTIISIYFLGKEFFSKKVSLVACYIFAFYGFPLFYLHFTYSETFVTALITLSLLFLVKSKNFKNRKNTLLFSFFFTLGNFSRWVVPLFIGGPLLLCVLLAIKEQYVKKNRDTLINFLLFIVFGVLPIIIFYYIPHFTSFSNYVTGNTNNASMWITIFFGPGFEGLLNPFSVHSIMFYFNILSEQTILFFTIFVLGFLVSLFKIKKYYFFLASFITPYLLFTFGSVLKFDRYIVPIYPSMAIISVVFFEYIKNKKFKTILIVIVIIVGFLNFIGSSWAVGPMGNQGLKDIVLPSFIHHPRRIYLTSMVWPPKREELNVESMFSLIKKDFTNKTKNPNILVTFEYHPYGNAIYTIMSYEKIGEFTIFDVRGIDYKTLFNYINKTDYVLIKDSKPIDIYYSEKKSKNLYDLAYMLRQLNFIKNNTNNGLPSSFVFIKKIPLPLDKTNVLLYKKTQNINTNEWEEFANLLITANPQAEDDINSALLTINK